MLDKRGSALRIGEPLRARIAIRRFMALMVCGMRDCGARIGDLHRWNPGTHSVSLDGMFRETTPEDEVPILELGGRYVKQWETARRQGVSWSQFRPRGRRAQYLRWHRKGHVPSVAPTVPSSVPFRFMCPVCRRVNLADFPRECTPDCPFHCPVCGHARPADRPHPCMPIDPFYLDPFTFAEPSSAVADSP